MEVDLAARRRYEAIFRAISGRARTALFLCLAATVAIAAAYALWVAPAATQAMADMGMPRWLIVGAGTAVFLSVALTLPNLAQLLIIRGDTAEALEGFNAWAMADAARRKLDGVPIRVFRKADKVMPWLTQHPEVRGTYRVRLLAWAGFPELARAELEEIPVVLPVDAFEHALLSAMIDFVATRNADLRDARDALTHVQAPDDVRARLALAFEQARLDLNAGLAWQPPLAAARREVTIPRAATILGRFLSGMRSAALFVAGGTVLIVLLTLAQ